MSIVTLVSGGLDSTLTAILIKEESIKQYPLFIDYGQICKAAEWKACCAVFRKHDLPDPKMMEIGGFGKLISSGLTNVKARLNEDAFLPGRNLLFLVVGAAYAYQTNSDAVAIGLLSEQFHLFPDQTEEFINKVEEIVSLSLGNKIKILTPLMKFSKADVITLAQKRSIEGTYSCHAGVYPPCGKCISCLEVKNSISKKEV
jgi:7-cyano-7-deazaguanine synthase